MSVTIDLSGKVALVTGASGALGSVAAQRLASAGAMVAAVYHTNKEKATAMIGSSNSGEFSLHRADVANEEEVEALVKKVLEEWRRIDILAHFAGINKDNLLMRMTAEEWDQVVRVNLRSAYVCTQAVQRTMMRQRYGRIILAGSAVGQLGNVGQPNYSATKAGVVGFARSVAREFRDRGVTINVLSPGYINAGMAANLSKELHELALRYIPMGRFGTADEVADATLFLASDMASYITGHVLEVGGGMVMS